MLALSLAGTEKLSNGCLSSSKRFHSETCGHRRNSTRWTFILCKLTVSIQNHWNASNHAVLWYCWLFVCTACISMD